EACRLEAADVLALRERTGDAADIGPALGPLLRAQPVFGNDVADADATTRLEYACDLGQHRGLVGRKVDHAVRDHDVDRVGGQWDLLDDPLEEVHVRHARIA